MRGPMNAAQWERLPGVGMCKTLGTICSTRKKEQAGAFPSDLKHTLEKLLLSKIDVAQLVSKQADDTE